MTRIELYKKYKPGIDYCGQGGFWMTKEMDDDIRADLAAGWSEPLRASLKKLANKENRGS